MTFGQKAKRVFSRLTGVGILPLIVPMALMLGLSGGATAGHVETSAKKPAVDKPEFFGTYLAAEYAAANSDNVAAAKYYLATLENDPDNILLQQKAYAALIASGRFDDAQRVATQLTNEKSATSLPQFFLVLALIRDGKYDKAQASLAQIPETGFQVLLNPLARAWILAGQGQTDQAITNLEVLDKTPIFRPFRRNHRAYIYAFAGDKTEADIAFKESLTSDPKGSLRAILAYGRFLAGTGRGYEAKQLYQKYQQLYPDEIAFSAAEQALAAGKAEKPLISSPAEGMAEALFSMASALAVDNAAGPAVYYLHLATFLKPGFSDAYLLLGRLLEADKAYEQALGVYGQVPAGDILWPEVSLRKAWVLDDLHRPDEALAIVQGLAKSNPGSAEFQISLGDMLRAHDKQTAAIDAYTTAINLAGADNKSAWPVYYARGTCYERLGHWPEAEADFKTALKLSPDQPQVLNYLGYSWTEKGIHLAEAQAMLEKAVELSPGDGFIADSLGWALYRQKKYAQAVEILERAVLQEPEDPTLNDHLGDAYWAAGRRNEAHFQWRHALSLGPTAEDAARIQAKLDKGLTNTAPPTGARRPKP